MASYIALKKQLATLFKEAILKDNFDIFLKNCQPIIATCENVDKSIMELTAREVLLELRAEKRDISVLERVFQFSIDAALHDMAPGNLPVLVIGDMFESSTLIECETVFAFVESRVETFKKDLFFKTCKNHLLRSCNDLLKRLSRSQNTVFCGRILLFLAHIFPLSERSGLNIISEFNIENTTVFSTNDDLFSDTISEKGDGQEEGEIPNHTHSSIMTDRNLYQKFWSLQEYFRNPNTCYNKIQWRHFTSCTSDILTVFGSFKSDDASSSKWKQAELPASDGMSVYFAKYLTSPKLLELELSDSHFRRYLLVQFLILFQYLSSPVKFKLETFQLTEEQQGWVRESTKKIYKLLDETPPNGSAFCQNVKHILKREEYWNAWKNEGCPDFKHVEEKTDIREKARKRPREESPMNKIEVGSPELTKLWNICPDNWAACRSPKRNFVPSMEAFFGKSDGSTLKRDMNDPKFAWKALRLLSMKSPHFFTVSANPPKNLSDYLETMIPKTTKEKPQNQAQEVAMETVAPAEDAIEDGNDEILQTSEEECKEEDKSKKEPISRSFIEALAEKLDKDWQLLAPHLGFTSDEIEYYEQTFPSLKTQAENMIIVWTEQEPESDMTALKEILQQAELFNQASHLF